MVNPLRIVFFGTPAFAVPTLERLIASAHPVVAVVTQPDRPRGRGQQVSVSPVKALAQEHHIDVLQPERMRDEGFQAALTALSADVGVVAAYGKLLPAAVLAAPKQGLINVHASLLPRYRGAAPVHRAVIAGERHTGVTIMRVVQALDAGPMLAKVSREIGPEETSADVERGLSELGGGLLIETVDRMASGAIDEVPQDDSLATYAHRISREDGIIDWNKPAAALHDLVRGLYPWPHAYSWLDSQRILILRSAVVTPAGPSAATETPGSVLEAKGHSLIVAAGSGTALAITSLQREGGKPVTAREFLAGRPLSPAARFHTLVP